MNMNKKNGSEKLTPGSPAAMTKINTDSPIDARNERATVATM
jgi:hypothetical protein